MAENKKRSISVVAMGQAPKTVDVQPEWTYEDALIAADITADKVLADGKEVSMYDKVGDTKQITAVPTVKGG